MLLNTLVIPWDLWLLSMITGRSVFSVVWVMFPKTETIKSHNSRARSLSNLNPASKEMISASVELWETAGLFLAHPTYWNQCMTSKNTQESTWCWFCLFQISCKIRVLKQSQSALFGNVSLMTKLFCSHMYDECTRSNALNVCHMLLSILWPHEQVCSRTIKIAGLQIRAKHRQFRTICEQTVDSSPTDPFSSSLKWWSSKHGVATLNNCSVVFSQVRNIFPRISLHDLPCHRTMKIHCLSEVSLEQTLLVIFFKAPAEFLDSNILLSLSTMSLLIWHSLWVQSRYTWSRNDVGSPKFQRLSQVFSMLDWCSASVQPVFFRPHTLKRIVLVLGWPVSIPNFGTFPNRILIELSRIAFLTARGWRVTVQISFKRNDWVFDTGPWFRPFVSW